MSESCGAFLPCTSLPADQVDPFILLGVFLVFPRVQVHVAVFPLEAMDVCCLLPCGLDPTGLRQTLLLCLFCGDRVSWPMLFIEAEGVC